MITMRVDPAVLIVLSLFPPVAAGIHHAAAWLHYRHTNRDAPPTARQRRLTKYMDGFVIGAGYLMCLSVAFGWPLQVWISLSLGWALSLCWLYAKQQEREKQTPPNVPLG
ncbi:MAG: hypothetical protein WA608_08635 [Candidatus Acidiferrales bacterium]